MWLLSSDLLLGGLKMAAHFQHPDYISGGGTGNAKGKRQVPAESVLFSRAFPDHLEALTYILWLALTVKNVITLAGESGIIVFLAEPLSPSIKLGFCF